MKAFVTGIAGFLGSHIAETLLNYGWHVAGVDNFSGGEYANIPKGAIVNTLDCNDTKVLETWMKGVDIVYHCAALPHEGLSVVSPNVITKSILNASISVFTAAVNAGVKRIVHCSSMSRYGAGKAPFQEWHLPAPQDPYAIAKVAAEQVLKVMGDVYGIEYVILVPHNIIGPRQKYDDPFRNVASIMANRMLQDRPPIIYGDGSQVRCFSDIDDVIPCLLAAGLDDGLNKEIINIGPDEEVVSIQILAEMLAGIIGFNGNFIYMPGRPQEVQHAVCSADKARKMLGYKTRVTLNDSLEKLVEYIRENGVRDFQYHLPIEIKHERVPATWKDKLI